MVFHASKLLQLATTAVSTDVSVEGDKWYQILQWCEVEHGTVYSEEEQDTWMDAVCLEVCVNLKIINHYC